MSEPLVFSRLYIPRPIEALTVSNLLNRLGASDIPRPLVFETWAADDGVSYVLGCSARSVHKIAHLLRGAIPGIALETAPRHPLTSAGRVDARQRGLPPGSPAPEDVIAAIYNSLALRKQGETLVLQIVLGQAHAPRYVQRDIADPLQPAPSRLWNGVRSASAATQHRLEDHAAKLRFSVALRVGVDGPDSRRREALVLGVFGALQAVESIGVQFKLRREPVDRLRSADMTRSPLDLTAHDLTPLLGWALGDLALPGADPLHPRRLPIPMELPRHGTVFAVGSAPGPDRAVGFAPEARLMHSVFMGPTGSGKSNLLELLALSDIADGRASAVIEPKRQLVDSILSRAPASAVGNIVVLDASDPHPVGFNPCELGEDDDPYVVADNLLAAFKALFDDGWGPRTEYLIQGALVTLLLAGQRRGAPYTLIDLPSLLTDTRLRNEARKYVIDDPALSAFWSDFEDMPARQRVSQIAAPLNKLRKLSLRRNLVAVLGQPSPRFKLRDIFREGKTLLVPLNEALIGKGAANFLGSLVLAELWTATLKRAAEREPWKRPGMVIVDEVQNYLHLPTDIGDFMATSRSYGVAWHVAHQFRAQLPPLMRKGFDSNARSKFIFALEVDDAHDVSKGIPNVTAEDLQRLDKYEVYCRLVNDGAPTDWFTARVLPPAPVVGAQKQILAASREQYGPQATLPDDEEPPPVPAQHSPIAPRGQKARRA